MPKNSGYVFTSYILLGRIETASLDPNANIVQHDMMPMVLPDVHVNEIYDQPETVRLLSEWVFSSTLSKPPTREGLHFIKPTPVGSPKQSKKPAPLVLKDDNFSYTNESPLVSMSDEHTIPRGLPVNNVFCLSGAPGSGKTQLAARMCEWLLQMKCLGGYFTFDSSTRSDLYASLSQGLVALPMTLVHQMSTVEPDSVGSFSKALTVEARPLQQPLEKKFETLFVDPIREFVASKSNGKWNPLDPLVFIIDGFGSSSGGNEDPDLADPTKLFVDWICSSAVGRLPRHVKFLILMRSETKAERLLRERGVKVLEMKTPVVRFVKEFVGSSNGAGSINGGWSSNAGLKSAVRAVR